MIASTNQKPDIMILQNGYVVFVWLVLENSVVTGDSTLLLARLGVEEDVRLVTIAEKSNRTRTRARFFKTSFVVYVVMDIF